MELHDLHVLHWRGEHVARAAAPQASGGQDLFLIDTCQRRLALLESEQGVRAAFGEFPADGRVEHLTGSEAYAFLLRFACGLESRLVAETEVFGQFKQAWRDFSSRGSVLARRLSPCIQGLFRDAKAIRAQFLGHLGSTSYGSQVRRLLGEAADGASGAEGSGAVLLVGAGQLAHSVAPWLAQSELWLANRSAARAWELARELGERASGPQVRVIEGGIEAELAAWRRARHVVVCVPADPVHDAARVAAWRERAPGAGLQGGRVIHLGLGAEPSAPWNELPALVSLGSLFDMLRAQSQLRMRALQRARQACLEKAVLRSLDASASHPLSWEDLAAFQNI